ncbi:MAG: hypothetical protein COA79_23600 [Planctomycetota bacterium]|nr:MAG: hypothetical protein COA79_23600 [Planctomycetota bacterium]
MSKKILVIDDDSAINDLLKLIFTREGYETDTASDGQIGFEKAVTDHYDLVTMDIKMPNWNGIEAIGSLEIVRPELKVIVVSGFIDEHENDMIADSPLVIDILKKPFNVADLIAIVKKQFGED